MEDKSHSNTYSRDRIKLRQKGALALQFEKALLDLVLPAPAAAWA
jgi:hypothetical protein